MGKLNFRITDEPSDLTLEEAFVGATGTVNLGKNGVALWVPGDTIPLEREIVFDIRRRPLSEQDAMLFRKACVGRFMNAHVALMVSTDPSRVQYMLEHFNYVLVPDSRIQNSPQDFKNRILSYTK